MRQLYLLLLVGLALAADPLSSCPEDCVCTRRAGLSEMVARCTKLDPARQVFAAEVRHLHVSGVPKEHGIVLDHDTFKRMGLQQVTNLRIIDSSFRRVHENAFSNLPGLMHLNLSGSDLILLHPDMFANNTQLEVLSLRYNQLRLMESEKSPFANYFLNIDSLRELDLYGCSLGNLLPTMFTRMPNLDYINLGSNGIKVLHKDILKPIYSLSELDLSENLIGELDPEVFSESELVSLNIRKNPLRSLRNISIPELETLDLSECKFSEITGDMFSGFPDLTKLSLEGNAINRIEVNAFAPLTHLQILYLSHNSLEGPLPENLFVNNVELLHLDLSNNPTMKLLPPGGFEGEFSALETLDLSHCGLEKLEVFSLRNMNRLTILKLAGNNLKVLPHGAIGSNVKILDLSDNQLSFIEKYNFPADSRITKLYLKGNPLLAVSPFAFSNLHALMDLDLSSCDLTTFPSLTDTSVSVFKSLRHLYLSGNRITSLNKSDLEHMPALEIIDVSKNPLDCHVMKNLVNYLARADIMPLLSVELTDPSVQLFDDDIITFGGNTRHAWDFFLKQLCGEEVATINYETVDDVKDNWSFSDNDEKIDSYIEDTSAGEIHISSNQISDEPSTWTIVVATTTSFAIIFIIIILFAVIVLCIRQENATKKAVRKVKAYKTPILRHGYLGDYKKLQEQHSIPSTPIMKDRNIQLHNELVASKEGSTGKSKIEQMVYMGKGDNAVMPEAV
ncbi:leucine-rich repeat-containing protein 15-like [Schistocerca serialis cubense]|uniref:leucine-rich repeat-containing protein 15-like n=1 Tax=Schistocerca serialis cubense TaxID=2023355 RepID=UPI00214E530E|nr:leucine-rich repeat-containing protein 15-like [Schistocerca serialis cubense]XP_049952246.1 leucine-rich repeat-containing protein 15-like [Schistocerca serialis cubense]